MLFIKPPVHDDGLGPVNTNSGRIDIAIFDALQGISSAMCLLHISEK